MVHSDPDCEERARDLYAEFLVDHPDASDAEIRTFIDSHPAEAAVLRRLVGRKRSSADLLAAALPGEIPGVDEHERRREPTPKRSAYSIQEGLVVADFELVRLLGRGGMGEVWEAHQISLNRRVALKLVLPERIGKHNTAFFEREARAGARLNHPGLVAVYEAGEDEGLVWISMELVPDGLNLTQSIDSLMGAAELAEDHSEDTARLIIKIADALDCAHNAGVIHRDIKPQNILITADGTPKVTDFGLARICDEVALSRTGEFGGTYYYMSPEQAASKRAGIDHRSDIFSLGVVMYELLALRRPFEGDTSQQVTYKVLFEDPPSVTTLRSRVPRELSIICAKALEKGRDQRYQSMAELAADLRRFLAHEPILAKPPGPLQRARKWTRRNPVPAVGGAIAAVALVVISWLLVDNIQQRRGLTRALAAKATALDDAEASRTEAALERDVATQALGAKAVALDDAEASRKEAALERDVASQRADELKQVSEFQARQLAGIDAAAMGLTVRAMVLERARTAGQRAGRTAEVLEQERAALEELLSGADFTGLALEVLDEQVFSSALRELEGFENQPRVQAELLQTVATTLRELGLLQRAMVPQEQALELRVREFGDEHRDTLSSANGLGRLLESHGDLEGAETILRETLEARRRTLGDEHLETLTTLSDLGNLLQVRGEYDEAELLIQEALETARRTLGDEHLSTLTAIGNLGVLLRSQGKVAAAEASMREVMEARRRTLGEDDPETLLAISNLGTLLMEQGRLAEAEAFYRQALAGLRRTLGDEHPTTLYSVACMGSLLNNQGKIAEAESFYREALDVRRRTLGDEHPDTLTAIDNLGNLFRTQGKINEAEELLREALEGLRRVFGDDHGETIQAMNGLGIVLQTRRDLDGAESLYREALEVARENHGSEHSVTLTSIANLGTLLMERGELDEAEALLREALEIRRGLFGDDHPNTLISIAKLGSLFKAQGNLEEAEVFFREALSGLRQMFGDDHPITLSSINELAVLLHARGKLEEVEPLLREALEARRVKLGNEHSQTILSITNLCRVVLKRGNLDEAEALARELVALTPEGHPRHSVCKTLLEQVLLERKKSLSVPGDDSDG